MRSKISLTEVSSLAISLNRAITFTIPPCLRWATIESQAANGPQQRASRDPLGPRDDKEARTKMKTKPVALPLVIALALHGAHDRDQDALPPDEHIELPRNHDPFPRGRVTETLTSTSTAAAAVSADLALMWNLK